MRTQRAGRLAACLLWPTVLSIAGVFLPGHADDASRCSRYSLNDLAPGMRASEVKKRTRGTPASTEQASGPFGPETGVTYLTKSSRVYVRYDRDISKSTDAKVVLVRVSGKAGTGDLRMAPRALIERFGEPFRGKEHLENHLSSGSAVWVDEGCGVQVTASRSRGDWWQPGPGEPSLEVASLRFAANDAQWRETGKRPPDVRTDARSREAARPSGR